MSRGAHYRLSRDTVRPATVAASFHAVPFVALWALAWPAVDFGYWELSFLLAVPAAGFLVRLFMIQDDCDMVPSFAIVWRTTGWAAFSVFDADALRRLAPRICDSSCQLGPS